MGRTLALGLALLVAGCGSKEAGTTSGSGAGEGQGEAGGGKEGGEAGEAGAPGADLGADDEGDPTSGEHLYGGGTGLIVPPEFAEDPGEFFTFGTSKPLRLYEFAPDGRDVPEYCKSAKGLLEELDAKANAVGGDCTSRLESEPLLRLQLECTIEGREHSSTLYLGTIWAEQDDGDTREKFTLRGQATMLNAKGTKGYGASAKQRKKGMRSPAFEEVIKPCR